MNYGSVKMHSWHIYKERSLDVTDHRSVPHIIFLTELRVDVLSENADVLISVWSHLSVHNAKQVEHLMEQTTSVLCPAPPVVSQLVGRVKDDLVVGGWFSIDCCTEPGPSLLDAGSPTQHLRVVLSPELSTHRALYLPGFLDDVHLGVLFVL